MVVVNPGDPVSTLRDALDAYTTVQETMIAESAKLKDPPPATEPPADITREGGMGSAVSSRY